MMNNQNDNEDDDIQVEAADDNSPRQSPLSRHQRSPLPRPSPALDEEEEQISRQMADGDDIDEYVEPTVEDQDSIEDAGSESRRDEVFSLSCVFRTQGLNSARLLW
jgi:hypothetical protein